jgi:hypothetical protein
MRKIAIIRAQSPDKAPPGHETLVAHARATVEAEGAESAGKTMLALRIIAMQDWGWAGGGSDVRCRSKSAELAAHTLGLPDLPLGWPTQSEYDAIAADVAALSAIRAWEGRE